MKKRTEKAAKESPKQNKKHDVTVEMLRALDGDELSNIVGGYVVIDA